MDLRAREVRRGGRRLRLQDKSFRFLAVLLEHPGEAVSREILRARLWPVDTFVEFDDGLNHVVRRLREALGDTSTTPKYIETVPRFGYRFVGQIQPEPTSPSGDAAGAGAARRADTDPIVRAQHGPRRHGLQWLRAALAIFAVVAGAVLARWSWSRSARDALSTSPVQSVAVLPFENLSGDPDGEMFAAGLTDTLITDLARLRTVRVASRASVLAHSGQRRDARSLGMELGVDAIVEGTVQHVAGRLRVNAQLVATRDDRHLWAERYDRDAHEVLALQDEIVRAIARPLDGVLKSSRGRGHSDRLAPEAYLAYQRGRFLMAQPAPDALTRATEQLRRAIERAPDFALAHAWLARCYVRMAHGNVLAPADAFAVVEREAARAVDLHPGLTEAQIALASARFLYRWRWQEAERLFNEALPRAPLDPEAHAAFADLLSALGRFDEALESAETAVGMDPVSLRPSAVRGLYAYLARRHALAAQQAQAVLDLQPHNVLARLVLGFAKLAEGDVTGGREQLEQTHHVALSPTYAGLVGHARARAGDFPGARAALRELEELSRHGYASPVQFAIVYAALGERDAAFEWLDRAYEVRDHDLAFIKVWPMLDPLRPDPRFAALVARMQFP